MAKKDKIQDLGKEEHQKFKAKMYKQSEVIIPEMELFALDPSRAGYRFLKV